jgi:hypothetical protein
MKDVFRRKIDFSTKREVLPPQAQISNLFEKHTPSSANICPIGGY